MTCIIVDDEPIAHRVLQNHIDTIDHVQTIGNFFNAVEAKDFLSANKVDFIFLDVEMPQVRGIDFLKSLQVKPITILTTAYRDYAVEGFELGVLDYLLKPISFERFVVAIKRLEEVLRLMQTPSSLNEGESSRNMEIYIKSGTQRILLDLQKITHAQGLKDYTILFSKEKRYLVKGSVKAMERYLPTGYFMRVHRSFLVAKDKIKLVNHNRIELGDISIPIGRQYKDVIADFLSKKIPNH